MTTARVTTAESLNLGIVIVPLRFGLIQVFLFLFFIVCLKVERQTDVVSLYLILKYS